MEKENKSNPDKLSDRLSENHKNKNPDNRHSNSDDPNEETEPQIKKMPITDHPHREEILD